MGPTRIVLAVLIAAAFGCKKKVPQPEPVAAAPVPTDAAIDAPPVPTLAEVLPAYVAVAEVYARIEEAIEDDYPGIPEDRTQKRTWTARIPTFKFYIEPWTSIRKIRGLAARRGEPLDRAVVAYLDHFEKGYPRVAELQAYVRREDYLDDAWGVLAAADTELRGWFAEGRRLAGDVRTGIAQAWPQAIGDAGSPEAEAWEACGSILRIVMADAGTEDEAIKTHVDACRPRADAVPNASDELNSFCDAANHFRRAKRGDRYYERRRAISAGIHAHHQLLSDWIGSDETLPPPADWVY